MKRLVFLFAFTILLVSACTTGSYIVTGTKRPAIPIEDVKIYQKYPTTYETIGMVKSQSEVLISQQDAVDRAVTELKKQAAKIGANGIIIKSQGEKSEGSVGTYVPNSYGGGVFIGGGDTYQTLSAEAIFVQ